MPRQPFYSPNQKHLFVIKDSDRSESPIEPWQALETDAALGFGAFEGSVIGRHNIVAERAERLILAINALAHRNMLMGLDVAAHDPEHKRPIWERYIDGTPPLLDNSRSKVDRLYDEAADHFWHATGVTALEGYGLKRRQVLSRVDMMWRGFTHDFGHPKVKKERNKFRRTQEKFLPMEHPLRSENRLKKYAKKRDEEKAA